VGGEGQIGVRVLWGGFDVVGRRGRRRSPRRAVWRSRVVEASPTPPLIASIAANVTRSGRKRAFRAVVEGGRAFRL